MYISEVIKKMQGTNHIISNTCSIVLSAECLFLVKDITIKSVPVIHNLCESILNIMTPHTTSTILLCAWWAGAVFLFYLGTLFPDCDSKNSILGRVFHIPVEHRTWTHAIWLPIILLICSFWVPILSYFCVGYFLHLFWDNLSVGGVCFLYPITKYKHYGNTSAKIKRGHLIKLYRTGKISEYIVVGILIAVTIAVTIYMTMRK